ncbi:hypothetical protein FB107DRAFT_253967, partial [Schizophyllum commune]
CWCPTCAHVLRIEPFLRDREDFDRFVVVVKEGTNARTVPRALFVYNLVWFCAWAWLPFIVTIIALLQTAHFWWPFFRGSSDV